MAVQLKNPASPTTAAADVTQKLPKNPGAPAPAAAPAPGSPDADTVVLSPQARKAQVARSKQRIAKQQAQAKAQPQPKPMSATGKRRQAARNRQVLDDYVRANGNMSVARRTAVVGRSLERLGYTKSQAHDIALDAPLDNRMHDSDALLASLQYASRITPDAARINPNAPDVIGADALIPMPKRAQAALQSGLDAKNPLKSKAKGLQGRFGSLWSGLGDHFAPFAERLGNAPVPGGLGGLFALNLLFLCAIVPVNAQGYTRLQLLYLTLINRTKLPEEQPPITVPDSPLFAASAAAIASVEDAASGIKAVASALGADVSQVGNVLSGIANASVTGAGVGAAAQIARKIAGGGGPPDAMQPVAGQYIPKPASVVPLVLPRFPGRP